MYLQLLDSYQTITFFLQSDWLYAHRISNDVRHFDHIWNPVGEHSYDLQKEILNQHVLGLSSVDDSAKRGC